MFAVVSGIVIGVSVPLVDLIVGNSRYLKLAWWQLRYRKQRVRLSVSYLFRIKLDNEYLLVRGHRIRQYQPVGGVYKVSPGAKAFLDGIGALDDDLIPIDAVSRNDLRIRIPGRYLLRFMRWFASGTSRETSPWREFYEELVGPEILPAGVFHYVFHDFIRTEIRPIHFSPYSQSMELLVADIYELLPTEAQRAALADLKDKGNRQVLWASEERIRRLGIVPGQESEIPIGEPAIWTL